MSSFSRVWLNFVATSPDQALRIINDLLGMKGEDNNPWSPFTVDYWSLVEPDGMLPRILGYFPTWKEDEPDTQEFHRENGSDTFSIELHLSCEVCLVPQGIGSLSTRHPFVTFEVHCPSYSIEQSMSYQFKGDQMRSSYGIGFPREGAVAEKFIEGLVNRGWQACEWTSIPVTDSRGPT